MLSGGPVPPKLSLPEFVRKLCPIEVFSQGSVTMNDGSNCSAFMRRGRFIRLVLQGSPCIDALWGSLVHVQAPVTGSTVWKKCPIL